MLKLMRGIESERPLLAQFKARALDSTIAITSPRHPSDEAKDKLRHMRKLAQREHVETLLNVGKVVKRNIENMQRAQRSRDVTPNSSSPRPLLRRMSTFESIREISETATADTTSPMLSPMGANQAYQRAFEVPAPDDVASGGIVSSSCRPSPVSPTRRKRVGFGDSPIQSPPKLRAPNGRQMVVAPPSRKTRTIQRGSPRAIRLTREMLSKTTNAAIDGM